MAYELPRRIVVWAEGPEEAARAADWAAAHAAARALPLHVVQVAEVGRPASAAGPAAPGGAAFAASDRAAVDVVRLARRLHRIRALHPGLRATVGLVEIADAAPAHGLAAEPGDLLVTGTAGFLRLAERARGSGPVPMVVVPDRAVGDTGAVRRRLLLLTGSHLSPGPAAFAFHTAADLGARLDVVRLLPQDGTFGDDYWIDTGRSAYRAESWLQNELSKLRARFPAVTGSVAILRARPWTTLRTMARGAHLAVLGDEETGRDPRALLEFGLCPVALVPES